MKILHTVQLYHPRVGGSEEVVRQLSERLARRGHDVTVATAAEKDRPHKIISGVKIKEFGLSGNSIFGIKGEITEYQEFLLENTFDVMMNYGSQIWSTDLALPLLPEIKAKKILIPLGFWGLDNPLYGKYYRHMPGHMKQYDKIIYLSDNYHDINFAKKHHVGNGMIIANAADENEFLGPSPDFREKYGIKTPYMLLSVSNHYHLKGHQVVLDAFKKLKRDDVTLVMIGGKPATYKFINTGGCYYPCLLQSFMIKNIRMLANVPRQDTVAAFKAADLFVFGSHFECSPLVIFEAMAAKTPFVSTDCGNVKDFRAYGSIVKNPEEMAGKINEWLNDDAKRKKTGQAAFENWQEHYTWERITDEYENLYRNLLGKA